MCRTVTAHLYLLRHKFSCFFKYHQEPNPQMSATIGPPITSTHSAVDLGTGWVRKTERPGIRAPIPSRESITIKI